MKSLIFALAAMALGFLCLGNAAKATDYMPDAPRATFAPMTDQYAVCQPPITYAVPQMPAPPMMAPAPCDPATYAPMQAPAPCGPAMTNMATCQETVTATHTCSLLERKPVRTAIHKTTEAVRERLHSVREKLARAPGGCHTAVTACAPVMQAPMPTVCSPAGCRR